MDFLIGFIFGALVVIAYLHGTKGCQPDSKRAKLRAVIQGGGGPDPIK